MEERNKVAIGVLVVIGVIVSTTWVYFMTTVRKILEEFD